MAKTSCRVKIQGNISEPINVYKGLRQGDSLASLLFNIALEWVIIEMPESKLEELSLKIDADLSICGRYNDSRTLSVLKEGFWLLAESGERMGLMVNEEKTKYMFVGETKVTLPDQITMNDYISTGGELHISWICSNCQ
jgi:hypothetical protein